MLLQFVTVLQGVLAPALLVMALSVMLTVGEGRDKPLSAYWRLAGFVVGFAGAVVFAALRATAVITQRTFVNYPTLWCCVILDVAVFVIVLFARRITADWHNHRALLDIANLVAALAIAATTFRALPDVILRLTIFVEPGDPIFTSDMLLRALGFALGAAVAIIAALIFRTMRSTAVRWSFTTAVLLLVALLFAQHFTDLAQILQSKRIVSFPTAAFLALVWGINHQRSLTIAMALVFAIPAIASIVMGFKVKPTGANEAIARTHIAFRRRAKAAGAFSLVAMICVTVALTYGVAQTQKVVTLSPPEDYSLADGEGRHLHAIHHHQEERRRVRRRPRRVRQLRRRRLLREGRQNHLQEVRCGHQPRHHRLQRRLQPDTVRLPGQAGQNRHPNVHARRAVEPFPVSAEKGKGVPCSS